MFEIKNQNLKRTDSEAPVSRSQGYLFAKFKFKSRDWDNLRKIVIFSNYKGAYKEELTVENDYTVLVPSSVLTGPSFRISVYSCDNIRITTNYEKISLIEGGYCNEFIPEDAPQTDLVCDILSRLDSKIDKVETDEENVLFYAEEELVYTLPLKKYVMRILEDVQIVSNVYLEDDDLNVDYLGDSLKQEEDDEGEE